MSVFSNGQWVQVSGLTSEKGLQLNGEVGQVQGAPADGRLPVQVWEKVDMAEYRKDMPCPLIGNTVCTRRYAKEPPCKLLRVENLAEVPQAEMTTVVRVACEGEAITGVQPRWKEVQLPCMHPIFSQPPNCPVPACVGQPLILTKVDFPQHRGLRGTRCERGFMQNVPCTRLRIDVEDGFVPSTKVHTLDDQDYIGPCYVCRPGGYESWTLADAEAMHAYLSYLVELYGDSDFDAVRELGPHHFRRFLGSSRRQEHRLLHAAHTGNAELFWECFTRAHGDGKVPVTGDLVEAAYQGLSGEVIGVLVTRSEHEIPFSTVTKVIEDMVDSCSESSPTPKLMWLASIVFNYNAGIAAMKSDQDIFNLVREGEAMYAPETLTEYQAPRSLESLGISGDLDLAFPFPEEQMQEWLSSTEYSNLRDRFTSKNPYGQSAGYFDGLACDMRMLKKFYSIGLEAHRHDLGMGAEDPDKKRRLRSEIRSMGWALFFRGSIDAMRIHYYSFQKALYVSPLQGREFFSEEYGCTRAVDELHAQLQVNWHRVGTWLN